MIHGSDKMKKKIVFFFPYPLKDAASQRFRFVQYITILESTSEITLNPFINEKFWKIYHQRGYFLLKSVYLIVSILRRLYKVITVSKYDFVFIHRELAPIGPPIFEFIVAKIFKKKIIYDFDDAIWLENYNVNNKKVHKLKFYSKVNKIIKWSYKISVGNKFLFDYVVKLNSNCVINPTTLDTENYHNPALYKVIKNNLPTIGWTGSATTNRYLDFLEPIFLELEKKYDFYVNIISDVDPKLNLKNYIFTQWNKESEVEDLMKFDIGVMPLNNDIWSQGKCGFKALQYMSLEIPAIVSPVGVNIEIVDDKINGFIAHNESEWLTILDQFLANKSQYEMMEKNARKKIVENYSVQSNTQNFLSLFT